MRKEKTPRYVHKETFYQAAYEGVPPHWVVQYYIKGSKFPAAQYFDDKQDAIDFENAIETLFMCPVCGGDRGKPLTDELKKLINDNGLISEMSNPGGRELVFKDKGSLQLHYQCSECDEKRIREFLSK